MEDNSNSQGGCQPVSPQTVTQSAIGLIYKITCLVSGKIYVGRTKQKLENRMAQHRHESKKGSPGLGAAIRKHGWENFSVEILETCTVESLNEREIFWIAKLDANGPNGYNLTEGGEGLVNPSAETRARMSANHPDISGEKNPNYGKKTPPEVCAKISAGNKGKPSPNKGKKASPETCAKISANHADVSGENNPNYGKKTSPETIAKMSESKKGEKNPIYGKHRSPETNARISAGVKAALARKKAIENGGNK